MNKLELDDVVLRWIAVSEMQNNVYVITHRASGQQLLIDAADDAESINALLQAAAQDAPNAAVAGIATTHQHWDHVRALPALAAQYPVPTYAGAEDASGIKAECGVDTSVQLNHLDAIALGSLSITAVALRGHTPGSIAYVVEDSSGQQVIISGDSLFPGGVGNTNNDPQRFTSLLDDVTERLFNQYGDEALVLPGHGDSTTLGAERPHLAEWRERGW